MPDAAHRIAVNIEDEMRTSYLDYAMSVIIGRALPDVRDGLKPVHRRVLFAMHEMGNTHDKPYKKSARIVGDVIGKYHPHGDAAVYDTIVRLAQDFSMRYPLVDGQGNFGSVDGDPPAAMRYTEIRMARLAGELLRDIDKETVDFGPNYDDSQQEPLILPCAVPNLLANGSSGIAVGMATNIPPHNLGELVEALVAFIADPAVTLDALMERLPGPDFPTGGEILGRDGIRQAYETGRGIIQVRATCLREVHPRTGREAIVVTEIPYQVNKARLVERIADLVREHTIEGIADIRDESDREGMRIVLEVKKDAPTPVIINQLYKLTPMQSTFGIINLAIVHGQPRVLSLSEMLHHFVEHRREVVRRRTAHDLRKARERGHILEGLKVALDHLDEVIALIRRAENPATAKGGLMTQFALTEVQAQAILDMRLQRLTALEREKILDELRQTARAIREYEAILASEKKILAIIVAELTALKEQYADPRRTRLVEGSAEIRLEDMIADEEMAVTVSHAGYIKRNALDLYRAQRRGGRGRTGMVTREEDFVEKLFVASTHSYVLCFTTVGKVYWLKVHEIPQAGRAAKGKAIVNMLSLADGEAVTAILPVRAFEEGRHVIVVTRRGLMKRTDLLAFSRPMARGIIALTLAPGDALIGAALGSGGRTLFLGSRHGMSIRFREEQVRAMGRSAAGVHAMSLDEGDEIVGVELVGEGATLLTVTENGYGKRSPVDTYPIQNRAGKGVITIKTTERNGRVVGVLQVSDEDDVMLVTDGGKVIRIRAAGISVMGRNVQGVRLMELEEGERVVSATRLAEQEDEEPEDPSA